MLETFIDAGGIEARSDEVSNWVAGAKMDKVRQRGQCLARFCH